MESVADDEPRSATRWIRRPAGIPLSMAGPFLSSAVERRMGSRGGRRQLILEFALQLRLQTQVAFETQLRLRKTRQASPVADIEFCNPGYDTTTGLWPWASTGQNQTKPCSSTSRFMTAVGELRLGPTPFPIFFFVRLLAVFSDSKVHSDNTFWHYFYNGMKELLKNGFVRYDENRLRIGLHLLAKISRCFKPSYWFLLI